MLRFLPLFLVAGCATRTPGRYVGAAITTVGAVGLTYAVARDCPEPMPTSIVPDLEPIGCGIGKVALGVLATTILAVGVTALIVNETTARDEKTESHARALSDPLDNPELRQLVLNASAAARERRCSTVYKLALRIEAIDPQLRHEGLLADPAIRMCLVPNIPNQ